MKSKLPCLIVFILLACCQVSAQFIQTKTYPAGKKLDEFGRVDYMGTFSAVYYLHPGDKFEFNQELSEASVKINDSVVRKRVKSLNYADTLIRDSLVVSALRTELLKVIDYAQKNETIKGFATDSIFSFAGKNSASNYNLYFISTGVISDSAVYRKALIKNRNVKRALFGVAFVAAFAAGYILIPLPGKKGSYKNGSLSGHIVIYDRKNKQICFCREQFFPRSEDPTDLGKIVKQVEYTFKEISN